MLNRKTIDTSKAPAAIGPYSQAIIVNGLCFVSGQLGLDPETGKLRETIEEQTRQSLQNIEAILAETGLGFEHVAKCTVFMADIAEFSVVNEIYAEAFGKSLPARSAFEVSNLPKSALVEIEAIAAFDQ